MSCIRIEYIGFNVDNHRAYCKALLLFFSQVSAPDEDTETPGRQLLAALLMTRPDDVKTADAEQSIVSG